MRVGTTEMIRIKAMGISRESLVSILLLTVGLFATVHAQKKSGIHSVDFRNYTFSPFGTDSGKGKVSLSNGKGVDDFGSKCSLFAVKYADFDGDGQEDAAIDIRTIVDGSMGHFDNFYVFIYRDDEVKVLFHTGVEKPEGMRVIGRSLLIDEPYYGPRDGECCPSLMTTTTYQWSITKKTKRN